MPDGNSLINLGDISKPATILIEKISDAIGGFCKPYQIKRTAKAEAEAEIMRAHAQIEITDLQRRAVVRFAAEEAQKQNNMERITEKAIKYIGDEAIPETMEKDWIVNFFDKCRLVSDEEMQSLWAKILAGEANSPGAYSKRTVNLMNSFDKIDAELFKTLCRFCLFVSDQHLPLVYDYKDEIYNVNKITFSDLKHLDYIGLVSFNEIGSFSLVHMPKCTTISYGCNNVMDVVFPGDKDNKLNIGHVIFTKSGRELFPIVSANCVDGFLDYIIPKWLDQGLTLASHFPRLKN